MQCALSDRGILTSGVLYVQLMSPLLNINLYEFTHLQQHSSRLHMWIASSTNALLSFLSEWDAAPTYVDGLTYSTP